MASPVDHLPQTPSNPGESDRGIFLTDDQVRAMRARIAETFPRNSTDLEAPTAETAADEVASSPAESSAKAGTSTDEAAPTDDSSETKAAASKSSALIPPTSRESEADTDDRRPNHKKRNIALTAGTAVVAGAITLVATLSGHGNSKTAADTPTTGGQEPASTAVSNHTSASTKAIAPGQTSVSIEKPSSAATSAVTSQNEVSAPAQSSKPDTATTKATEGQPHHKNPNNLGNTWYDPNGPVELSADEYKDTSSLVDAFINQGIAGWVSGGTTIKNVSQFWDVVIGYKGAPWTNGVVQKMQPDQAANAFAAYNEKIYGDKLFAPGWENNPNLKALADELTRENSATIEGYAVSANNRNTGDYSAQVDSSDESPDNLPFVQEYTNIVGSPTITTDRPDLKQATFTIQRKDNAGETILAKHFNQKDAAYTLTIENVTWRTYETPQGNTVWLISDATLADS